MKDFNGVEVHVGDLVTYVVPKYSVLKSATIVAITRCGVTLDNQCNRRSYQIVKGETPDANV